MKVWILYCIPFGKQSEHLFSPELIFWISWSHSGLQAAVLYHNIHLWMGQRKINWIGKWEIGNHITDLIALLFKWIELLEMQYPGHCQYMKCDLYAVYRNEFPRGWFISCLLCCKSRVTPSKSMLLHWPKIFISEGRIRWMMSFAALV